MHRVAIIRFSSKAISLPILPILLCAGTKEMKLQKFVANVCCDAIVCQPLDTDLNCTIPKLLCRINNVKVPTRFLKPEELRK